MSTFAVYIILALTGQAWGSPGIYEAELAAPVEIESGPSVAPADNARDAGRVQSWDLDTPSPRAAENASNAPVQELRWEYDDDGKPVARPSSPDSAPVTEAPRPVVPEAMQVAPPQPQSPPAQAPAPPVQRDTAGRVQGSRPVAAFWFVMPKTQ